MLEGYYLRRPAPEEIKAVFDLMLACDVRDVGFPDSDLDDLTADWERMDLQTDAWLVFDKDHVLKGYGAVMPWTKGKLIAVYDAPGTEQTDIFLGLTILCEGRAIAMLRDMADGGKTTIAHYISDSAEYQKEILTQAGYSLTKFLFNMHRPLEGENPPPTWPQGYSVRRVIPGEDDESLHALIQDAFAKPGRVPQPFEEWKSAMMNPLTIIPELWIILEYQGDLAGCALCFEYDDLGWVRQLAVREDHRGKKLGRKLLQQAFHVFDRRGFPKVGLAVEAENTNALNLYQSAGMVKAVHLDEYSKTVPAPAN